jgi:hypothetical protein
MVLATLQQIFIGSHEGIGNPLTNSLEGIGNLETFWYEGLLNLWSFANGYWITFRVIWKEVALLNTKGQPIYAIGTYEETKIYKNEHTWNL